ncbi:MAG TPA: chorismate synthase [Taishania sp.]|nr:chorismate synthase [Taishania sp.]
MNSFGQLFRIQLFGESHGDCVGILIDGCPPGISISEKLFETDLKRRQGGNQKGTTPRKEDDIPCIKSGVFNETSTGAPILIYFENKNTRSEDYQQIRSIPRPGHADFVAHKKFQGFEDYRGGGHFSARLTTGIVAAGCIAKQLIGDMNVSASIIEIGGETDLDKGLQKAINQKDTIGGIIQCTVSNVPIGLGEPYFDSLESRISQAMFSIPAVKGIEFGIGFKSAQLFGSEVNDSIIDETGKTATNNAGGINGGISNGNDLVFRIAIKPASSTPKEQTSFNWHTNTLETFSIKGRHDLCVALRAPVIVEALTAIVLADFTLLNK